MTKEEMKTLEKGGIVKNVLTRDTYVVMANYSVCVTVVRHCYVNNPCEWLVRVDEEWIKFEDLKYLRIGDAIKSILRGGEYVIVSKYSDHAIAVNTADIINPEEWEIVTEL